MSEHIVLAHQQHSAFFRRVAAKAHWRMLAIEQSIPAEDWRSRQ
jgi:hypothetical protein